MSAYPRLKRVVVAEDDPDLRELLAGELASRGLTVCAAKNGEEAKRFFHEPVDLLITDFRMPMTNGAQLLAWCRSKGFHCPVIFLSGDVNLLHSEQVALGDCCATLLSKPFEPKAFWAAVGAADARSHHKDCIHLKGKPSPSGEHRP